MKNPLFFFLYTATKKRVPNSQHSFDIASLF